MNKDILDFAKDVDFNRKRLISNIREKGGFINDTDTLSTAVSINNTLQINTASDNNKHRVRWIDIDGTILKTEYVAHNGKVSVPDTPTYDSKHLEFVEWVYNGDLNNITEDLDCGAIYRPIADENGIRWTHIYIYLDAYTGLDISLKYRKNSTSNILYIDWGDGIIEEVTSAASGAVSHTYSNYGEYIVKVYSNYKGFTLNGTTQTASIITPTNCVTRFYIGDNLGTMSIEYMRCLEIVSIYGWATVGYVLGLNCNYLKTIFIPTNITAVNFSLGVWADCNCKIILHSNITKIGNKTFTSYAGNLSLPKNLTEIGYGVFNYCTLKYIEIPEGISKLTGGTASGNGIFEECHNLEEVSIKNSNLYEIGPRTFYNCKSLTKLNLPANITAVGNNAFDRCMQLESIILPNAHSIGNNAFYYCRSLKTLVLPNEFDCDLYLFRCVSLSDETLCNIAYWLKDNTGSTPKTITFSACLHKKLNTLYLNNLGDIVAETDSTAIPLIQYIQNKNWTIVFNAG